MIRFFSSLFALLMILAVTWTAPASYARQVQVEAGIHCPFCGVSNQPAARFCSACGSSLPQAGAPVATAAREPAAEQALAALTPASAESDREAEALNFYKAGFNFLDQGAYELAATSFRRVVTLQPASAHARESELLARACDELAMAKSKSPQPAAKSGGSAAAAFGGAFIGGALGTLGGVMLLFLMASGS
ncbi:MAG: hypothetical protein DKINENOH_02021 [bacterium]|nr:hypothetical protein [bacterium]